MPTIVRRRLRCRGWQLLSGRALSPELRRDVESQPARGSAPHSQVPCPLECVVLSMPTRPRAPISPHTGSAGAPCRRLTISLAARGAPQRGVRRGFASQFAVQHAADDGSSPRLTEAIAGPGDATSASMISGDGHGAPLGDHLRPANEERSARASTSSRPRHPEGHSCSLTPAGYCCYDYHIP